MGSDYAMLGREIAVHSHGSLMQACKKAEKKLLELGLLESDPLIKEIRQAIANGSMF